MSSISEENECRTIVSVNKRDENLRCEKRQREKSLRDSNGAIIDEVGFILVKRRRPKGLVMRKSSGSGSSDDIEMMNGTQEDEKIEKIEVSVTSKEILPKQMALAKLLRVEGIQSILRIKYKSPYKVLIQFSDKENAHKLLNNKKFAELDYSCQLTQELQTIFGIVRNIDLDVQEKEMMEVFESELEILSIKRLKRFLDNGNWVESESVRVCFKSSTLPSYIIIYGCRFKVEPFTFPVTQCSSCWRYGHSKVFCPIKKVFCPKCGKQHSNCETKLYTCINCKGNHMSLDRESCPVFHKEKEIRKIMSKENCKYRKALIIYYNQRKLSDRLQRDNLNEENEEINNQNHCYNYINTKRSYRDILVTAAEIHKDDIREDTSNSEKEEDNTEQATSSQNVKRKRKRVNKAEKIVYDTENIIENKEKEQHQPKIKRIIIKRGVRSLTL